MSASYWIEGEGSWDDDDGYVGGCTYNLGDMLRAANPAWNWYKLVGAPVSEVGGMLQKTLATLTSDPERFKAFNPANGWGDYDGLVQWLERFVIVCGHHPKGFIGGSV